MKRTIEVGAAVFDHYQAMVGIGRFEQRREHNSAGGDTEQHQSIDAARAQDHFRDQCLRPEYALVELRIHHFAGGLGSENRQCRIREKPDLLEYAGLVPVDMLMRELTFAELHNRNQRHLNTAMGGATPGSIQGISCVWVKEKIISSTSWFSPTVRDTGVSVVSGGILGIKCSE